MNGLPIDTTFEWSGIPFRVIGKYYRGFPGARPIDGDEIEFDSIIIQGKVPVTISGELLEYLADSDGFYQAVCDSLTTLEEEEL